MQPFLLEAAYKDYLWGGVKLRERYHKSTELSHVAESWEFSVHPDGETRIASGEAAGRTLAELLAKNPALAGRAYHEGTPFPLLIKLIDAAQSLSVQVHPDDAYAATHGAGLGKTEVWYILDCEPDAFLYLGFEREISSAEFRTRIENNTLTEVLHRVPVQPGEAYFIHAGTVHAVGAGIVLAEVQQNSNTTYRVYDFDRRGKDGELRELHIEHAVAVAKLGPACHRAPDGNDGRSVTGGTLRRLARCAYFTADALALSGTYTQKLTGESFCSVLCTSGECTLRGGGAELTLRCGESAFIPANCGTFTLTGEGAVLLTGLGGH